MECRKKDMMRTGGGGTRMRRREGHSPRMLLVSLGLSTVRE